MRNERAKTGWLPDCQQGRSSANCVHARCCVCSRPEIVQGFGRRPARTSATRATPVGRRSKATRERNRGKGQPYQQALWKFGWRGRRSGGGAARRAPELFGGGRHGCGVGRGAFPRMIGCSRARTGGETIKKGVPDRDRQK